MPSKVWNEITNPFPNYNGATVEVWEWIGNFIPHFLFIYAGTFKDIIQVRPCCL